jgi:la-related protein 1
MNSNVWSVTRERLSRLSRSPARTQPSHAAGCYWIKEGDKEKFLPLPEDADFILYDTLHENALHHRRITSNNGQKNYDLDILYNFWSHFLIRDFNSNMYEEFCFLASEDFKIGSTFGIDRLLGFYSKALMSEFPIRDRVAKDYVALVTEESGVGKGKAFMELRRAWRNGATNLRNRKKLSGFMEAKLREELDR